MKHYVSGNIVKYGEGVIDLAAPVINIGDGNGSAKLNFKLLAALGEGAITMNDSEKLKCNLGDGSYIQVLEDIFSTAKIEGAIIFQYKTGTAANTNEIYEASDDSDHIKAKNHSGIAVRLD